jgi:ABC-type branched-subunit amino acid transport system ATPase component
VIADDDPQTVLANTEVRAAYLGTQGEAANG